MDKINYQISFGGFEEKSDGEKIELLNRIIDSEIAKDDSEIDLDLIQECSDYIKELLPDSEKSKEAELAAIRDSIKQGKGKKRKRLTVRHELPGKKRRWLRITAISAASLMLIFVTLSAFAVSNGYSSAIELISSVAEEIIHWKPGETAVLSNITVIKNGESAKYPSFEDFLQKEDISVLIPTRLPEGEKVTGVIVTSDIQNGEYIIIYSLSSGSTSISVRNSFHVELSDSSEYNSITTDYGQFVIVTLEDGTVEAVCHTDSYEYIIASDSYDKVNVIVQNMKEVQK